MAFPALPRDWRALAHERTPLHDRRDRHLVRGHQCCRREASSIEACLANARVRMGGMDWRAESRITASQFISTAYHKGCPFWLAFIPASMT